MAYYLGIDGGGTKTRSVLGDENNVLASAVSGGSNVIRLGEARAREALHTAIRQACAAANLAPQQIDWVCIGASGAGRPEIVSRIQELVAELDSHLSMSRVRVVPDTVIALQAAFGTGPGVVAIAGTGSIVFGRDASGRTARAGGWGFAISDEGSGQWIGRHAVSAVMRARDKQKQTTLTSHILEAWKLPDIDALIQFANSTPPPEFPRLFPVVLRAANEGDSAAMDLLRRAGTELGNLAIIVLERVAPIAPYVPVAMTGSVFRQSAEVRSAFYNHIEASFPGIELRSDLIDPALGALAMARSAARAPKD